MFEQILNIPLACVVRWYYSLCGGYVRTVVIFTFLMRIFLLPVSLWVQRSGIKMVERMPELNRLKIRYYGDKGHHWGGDAGTI